LLSYHQDYFGLPIITCAINRIIKLDTKENTDRVLRIKIPDINEE